MNIPDHPLSYNFLQLDKSIPSQAPNSTKKPLFILNSNLKLLPEAKDRLNKRAIVRDDPKELIDSLRDYLVNDNMFSYYYSDPYGDGNLYKRASDLVVQACNTH